MPTIIVHPSAILESESSFQSIDSSYPFSNAIGKGTDSSTYAQWYMVTGGAAFTTVYYAFDLSEIPENATITSVTCEAKCQCQNSSAFRGGNNALALYSGDTKMSATPSSTAAFGTTATVVEIPEATWTREQLNNCKILIQATRGFLSTSTSYYIRFYGADLTVTYEVPETGPIFYIKEDGEYKVVQEVYKKINNTWVEQTDISSIFNENTNYIKRG